MGEVWQRGPPPPPRLPVPQRSPWVLLAPQRCSPRSLALKTPPHSPRAPVLVPLQPGWLVRGCPESSVPRRGMRCGGTCTETARARAPVGPRVWGTSQNPPEHPEERVPPLR